MATEPVTSKDVVSEIAIFGRLIKADASDLSHDLARYILTLGFDDEQQARINDLAERNQSAELSTNEKLTLENYVKASHLLALLHSKARRSLNTTQN